MGKLLRTRWLKTLLDKLLALLGFVVVSPLFIVVSVILKLKEEDVFFIQTRVGQYERPFGMYKFTTMLKGSEKKGSITTASDPRVTGFGRFLRRYKINELPQILNVLKGDMSLVGPRPLLREHANLYPPEACARIYSFKPGITGYGSLEFSQEDGLLDRVDNFEKYYAEVIMPRKAELELRYVNEWNLLLDVRILIQTIWRLATGWMKRTT